MIEHRVRFLLQTRTQRFNYALFFGDHSQAEFEKEHLGAIKACLLSRNNGEDDWLKGVVCLVLIAEDGDASGGMLPFVTMQTKYQCRNTKVFSVNEEML